MSKLRVSLKFLLNQSFLVKVMNETSLRNIFLGLNCHENKLVL